MYASANESHVAGLRKQFCCVLKGCPSLYPAQLQQRGPCSGATGGSGALQTVFLVCSGDTCVCVRRCACACSVQGASVTMCLKKNSLSSFIISFWKYSFIILVFLLTSLCACV